MGDNALLKAINDMADKLEGFQIAARIPAEPGWFVVIVEPTGLKDVSEPETLGIETYLCRIYAYPITEWGLPMVSGPLAPEKPGPQFPFLDLAFGFLGALGKVPEPAERMREQLPPWLPIDPSNRTRFVSPGRIFAIYSPSDAQDAREAIKKTRDEMRKRTEEERERAAKAKERKGKP